MPTSVKDFFDRRVPEALTRYPDKAKEVAATFQFTIHGPDGGIWTADLVSSPAVIQSGATGQPQCTIDATDDDFRSMIDGGTQVAMQLFFSGKLKIAGDPMLLSRMLRLLQMNAGPVI